MIVSTAIVVLPVLRSPMISSRWPRPIGVIASIDLMPVCSGSCTGRRPVIPGAWISIRRCSTPESSPSPSIGSPRALTTRPSTPSPTGTDRIRPVDLTVCPSSMLSTSPRTTAPIDLSSRLRARPTVPSSNSSSSLTAASGSPATLAMPSPTSETRPTVRASSDGVKPSRFAFSAAAMSVAERVSSAMSLGILRECCAGYKRLLSWSRWVRTLPSMIVSPTVATSPPSTDGSTTTLREMVRPVALAKAARRRSC